MARKIYYKILEDGKNKILDSEWDDILRLQKWYNAEFIWTAGKLGFMMYAVFPKTELKNSFNIDIETKIQSRRNELRKEGLSDNETILQLESEGLITARKGGYFDNCLASGFTRVAGNEFNAYLVCEFLLKASTIAQHIYIQLYDEGLFVKSKNIEIHQGDIILRLNDLKKIKYFQSLILNHRVFSIVDPEKYDHHPNFGNTITGYNDLTMDERQTILKDWNWLGFENNYDLDGDDIRGYNLNSKVKNFILDIPMEVS